MYLQSPFDLRLATHRLTSYNTGYAVWIGTFLDDLWFVVVGQLCRLMFNDISSETVRSTVLQSLGSKQLCDGSAAGYL